MPRQLSMRASWLDQGLPQWKESGPGQNKRKALDLANGDYILFADSDDYVKHNYIPSYTDALEEGGYDIAIGDYIRDIASKKTTYLLSNSVWSLVTYATECAKLFKKSFIVNNLGFTRGIVRSSFVGHLFQSAYLMKRLFESKSIWHMLNQLVAFLCDYGWRSGHSERRSDRGFLLFAIAIQFLWWLKSFEEGSRQSRFVEPV